MRVERIEDDRPGLPFDMSGENYFNIQTKHYGELFVTVQRCIDGTLSFSFDNNGEKEIKGWEDESEYHTFLRFLAYIGEFTDEN